MLGHRQGLLTHVNVLKAPVNPMPEELKPSWTHLDGAHCRVVCGIPTHEVEGQREALIAVVALDATVVALVFRM